MARMLPAQYDESTSSMAERRLFDLLKHDPATQDWVVLHSLGLSKRGRKPYGEIDFVVMIPHGGVLCLEVKGGRIACHNGVWQTTDRSGRTEQLRRSPFLQAREGMFALRDVILDRVSPKITDDLIFGYAVVMPDVSFTLQSPEWESWQIMDHDALTKPISSSLLQLVQQQRKLHQNISRNEPASSTIRALQQLLRPDFEVVVTCGTQIEDTEARILRLTEEQFAALDLLADNERCLFEGAAGTGKTMLALEYARRSAQAGKRTLLLCFNRMLGDWLERRSHEIGSSMLVAGRYYKLLRETILQSSLAAEFSRLEQNADANRLFGDIYPAYGQLAVEEAGDHYEVIVMDEAQDLLKPNNVAVFDAWLKEGLGHGHWAIFADFQRQTIFGSNTSGDVKSLLMSYTSEYTRGRLTLNCRNTRNIGEETSMLSGFSSPPYRMGHITGLPVDYRYYDIPGQQCVILQDVLRRLLADEVRHSDIVILSTVKLSNSGVADLDGGRLFRLMDVGETLPERFPESTIRFATVQAFKGMESPVIILCDIEDITLTQSQSLLYVAMSRARSQLIMLVNQKAKPSVVECVRRRLSGEWRQTHE